jgi:hypothetical protein
MADVAFIAVILAFFAVCVLYVRLCDRIIARGEPVATVDEASREASGDAYAEVVR